MPGRETIRLRTGEPGSGKSYSIICELLEHLEETDGLVLHNLPLDVEAIADHFHKQYEKNGKGLTPGEVRRRLILIPKEVERTWALQEVSPSVYFDSFESLADAWIILDEAHNFIGRKHEAKYRRLWQEFTGELRHRGACLELVTQSLGKLADEIECDAGVWIEVSNCEADRDPFFWIPLSDWWQFSAKLNGHYVAQIRQQEHKHEMRRWVANDKLRLWRQDPYIYSLYHSYSAPKNGGAAGRRLHAYETRNWIQLFMWFIRRWWTRLIWSPVTGFLLLVSVVMFLYMPSTLSMLGVTSGKAPASSSSANDVGKDSGRVGMKADRPESSADSLSPVPSVLGVSAVFDDGVVLLDGSLRLLGDDVDGAKLQECLPRDGVCILSDSRRLQVASVSTRPASDRSVPDGLRRSSERSTESRPDPAGISHAQPDGNRSSGSRVGQLSQPTL
jgi:hypothetical protein